MSLQRGATWRRQLLSLHQQLPETLHACRTGAKLASGGADKTIKLWDASSAEEVACLHAAIETVNDVAFPCVPGYLLAAGSDNALQVSTCPNVSASCAARASKAAVHIVPAAQPLAQSIRLAAGPALRCLTPVLRRCSTWAQREPGTFCEATQPGYAHLIAMLDF